MSDVLRFNEEPIKIPAGVLTDGTRDHIEKAVALNVPEGAHLAVLAMLDEQTGQPLTGHFGAAVKLGTHWKLTAEAEHTFGGPTKGMLGVVGVF